MTKSQLAPTPVAGDAVKRAITGKDSFAQEIRTAALFKEYGGRVQHGWSYLDPVEEKARQFDLRADLWHRDGIKCISFAAECKNLDANQPLVISGTARTKEESFHHFVVSGRNDSGTPIKEVREVTADARGYYSFGEFVGKSVIRLVPANKGNDLEPKRDEETDIYKRWSQALASAAEPCKRAMTDYVGLRRQVSTVVLPIVVVPDGSLWMAFYAADGNLIGDPSVTDSISFFVNHEITIDKGNDWIRLSHIHFFTATGLRTFLRLLRDDYSIWEMWFPPVTSRYQPPIH